jgi:hypothetical protein
MLTVLNRRSFLFVAVLSATFLLAGCSDEGDLGTTTSILGTVVDPVGDGIFAVEVAVVYNTISASAPELQGSNTGPYRASPSPRAVTLFPPFPNPATLGPPTTASIQVEVDAATTLRVEILTAFGGSLANVATVFEGTVTQDTVLVWDGRDRFAGLAPNAMYTVRLTSPANPPQGVTPDVQEQALLVNRSTTDLFGLQEGFNAVTDVNGEYLIDDLAVEGEFIATNVSGDPLGTRAVGTQLALYFWDPKDQFQQLVDTDVVVLKGETLEKTTQLSPIFRGRRPEPASIPF